MPKAPAPCVGRPEAALHVCAPPLFFVLNMLSLIIYMSDPNGMVYNDDLAKLTLALV